MLAKRQVKWPKTSVDLQSRRGGDLVIPLGVSALAVHLSLRDVEEFVLLPLISFCPIEIRGKDDEY